MTFLIERCPWYVGGLLLASVTVLLQCYANLPMGVTGSVGDTQDWIRRGFKQASWRVFFLVGIVIGSFIHSFLGGGFKPDLTYGFLNSNLPAKAAVLLFAGTLVGFGARTAGGCTSGHGLCGISRGSGTSLKTTITFMAVAIGVAHLLRAILGAAS